MSPSPSEDFRAIFDAHAGFVWRALARSGVKDADLRDATQEVFITVARKLGERDQSAAITTWLYGIAIRVAANHRRKVQRRQEDLTTEPPEIVDATTPEGVLGAAEARQRLAVLLETLPDDQRLVFVMFELEEMTCPAIAERIGIPLGTVYTRLRAARATFESRARRLADGDRR